MGPAGVVLQCSDRIGAWGYSESTVEHDCCLVGQQRGITLGIGGAMGEGRVSVHNSEITSSLLKMGVNSHKSEEIFEG